MLLALMAPVFWGPLRAIAQQPSKVWRVGALFPTSRAASTGMYRPFVEAARELGYVEGQNLVIDWKFADDHYDRLPGLAAELVKARVDMIITVGNAATRAAQQATSTVPVVSATMIEPVQSGFAESLARPGRNITGLANTMTDISGKHVELLATVVPKLSRITVLFNSQNPVTQISLKGVHAAAQTRGLEVVGVDARNADELEKAFAAILKERPQALIVFSDVLFVAHLRRIAEFTLDRGIPSIFNIREYAGAGGLMSYGQPISYYSIRTATYMDKIFKGAKPGELPIEQPTNIDFVINRKTAARLGINIPTDLLLRAHHVID
jgi:putative tryptophan/tyrosine transport system substrate-binding protein